MGRNARLRRERHQELPESWFSERHGHVIRDNYKGCQVVIWDFEADDPIVLMNLEKRQIHTNLAYFPEGWGEKEHRKFLKDGDIDPDLFDYAKTSF